MVTFTRSMTKTKHIEKKKKAKLLPPIRVQSSDKTIISKSDSPPKKGKFIFLFHIQLIFDIFLVQRRPTSLSPLALL